MIRSLLGLLAAIALCASAQAGPATARDWIAATKGQPGRWEDLGPLDLPSGRIFIGDPSWGDDDHLTGNRAVPARHLQVWILVARPDNQVHAVWLEAAGSEPALATEGVDFGVDAALIGLGDLRSGEALTRLGSLGLPGIDDSYEFVFGQMDTPAFVAKRIAVPPDGLPIYAIGTGSDGGYRAVWVTGAAGEFSGILIDITGRSSDGRFVDLLIGSGA